MLMFSNVDRSTIDRVIRQLAIGTNYFIVMWIIILAFYNRPCPEILEITCKLLYETWH